MGAAYRLLRGMRLPVGIPAPVIELPWWGAIIWAGATYLSLRYGSSFIILGNPAARVVADVGQAAAPILAPLVLALGLAGTLRRARVRHRLARRGRSNSSSGQALIEMALITPLLLLLALGCVDFGRAFYTGISLANAAREAAHQASLPTASAGQLGDAPVLRAAYCQQPYFAWNFVPPAGDPCAQTSWSSWSSAYTPAPASPLPNTAYIAVAEDDNFPGDVPTGAPQWNSGARLGGHRPVLVQVDYYWQPLTPFMANLLPSGVIHLHLASEEREQY